LLENPVGRKIEGGHRIGFRGIRGDFPVLRAFQENLHQPINSNYSNPIIEEKKKNSFRLWVLGLESMNENLDNCHSLPQMQVFIFAV